MHDLSPFRFGTVGSPKSTPARPGGSVGAVLRLKELGLGALELGWVNAVRVSEASCAVIKETAQAQDIAISVHAPYFINLNADDEEWPRSRKRLMDAAHFGNLAGATDIVFHPGTYFGRPAEEVLKKSLPRLQGCVDELRAAGNSVCLRTEMMGKIAMLGSLEDTLQMSHVIEGVQPCTDFAHLHARGVDGYVNTYDEWAKVLDTYAKQLGEAALHTMHIHLSGIEYGPKGERKHLPIEEADLDIQALFRALHDFECRGRILCESPILEDDALKLKELWDEIRM